MRFAWRQCAMIGRKLRWMLVAGRNRNFVSGLQPGLKIRLHGDSELCHLIYCRHFEAHEREFLNRFLRPGDVFVDVGANIGLFTLIAAERVGPKGKVLAFEPAAKTFGRLVDNVGLNKLSNVECFRLALSDSRGHLQLTASKDGYDAWNSLAKVALGELRETELVEVIEWDQFAGSRDLSGGSVTMMKIDVEGWESRVLEGGKEFFIGSDAPVLQVEFTDDAAEAAGSSCHALYERLQNYGYEMFVYDAGKGRLVRESRRAKYPYLNIIAAKNPDFINSRIGSASGLQV
jgi:FkbM family methyltransferase